MSKPPSELELKYFPKSNGQKSGTSKKASLGKGSRKGTIHAREAIALFVERNTPKLAELIHRIEAENGPLAAFKCIESMIEYHVPRVSRVEHMGTNEGPVEMVVRWGTPTT